MSQPPAATDAPRPRIAVILRHGLNPDAWARRYRAGETWDETPYGYHLAADHADLRWSRDHVDTLVTGLLRKGLRRALGFDLVHVWRNRALLTWSDAVWTHTEREHLAVAAVLALAPRRGGGRGSARTISIAQSVWLWDTWPGGPRRALDTRLLRRHAVELVLSPANRDVSDRLVPGRQVVFVPFGTQGLPDGVAHPGHTAPPSPTPVVLAVGNDRHRDWDLLAAVARELPEVRFDVVSLSDHARATRWPANASVRSSASTAELAAAYAASDVVALPLTANLHASGCTVAIEAMTSGTPLVVTDAGGIGAYVAGSGSLLVPVGDPAAFAVAIRTALADPDAHRARPDHQEVHGLTQRAYVDRVLRVTRAVLAGDEIPPDVSSTARQEL